MRAVHVLAGHSTSRRQHPRPAHYPLGQCEEPTGTVAAQHSHHRNACRVAHQLRVASARSQALRRGGGPSPAPSVRLAERSKRRARCKPPDLHVVGTGRFYIRPPHRHIVAPLRVGTMGRRISSFSATLTAHWTRSSRCAWRCAKTLQNGGQADDTPRLKIHDLAFRDALPIRAQQTRERADALSPPPLRMVSRS